MATAKSTAKPKETEQAPETPAPAPSQSDVGQSELQARADARTSRGFAGSKADPNPNDDYTVAGVTGKE